MPTRAIAYARYSPRPDAADCESIDKQMEAIREHCQRKGYELVSEHCDRALSGSDAERPGLWEAVAALKRGHILIVRDLDRLTRDIGLQEYVFAQVRKKKAQIESISGGLHDDDPTRELIRNIFGSIATWQRSMIRQRTSYGMQRNQRNGRSMSSQAPYGYARVQDGMRFDKVKKIEVPFYRLVEDPIEQANIATILRLHADGMGLREIGRKLAQDGITCRGGEWHHALIGKIIERASSVDTGRA